MKQVDVIFGDSLIVDLAGTKVKIKVDIDNTGTDVKFQIDAPRHIPVNREEVHRAKKRNDSLHPMKQNEIGMVRWFDHERGMGFAVNEEGYEIFLHYKHFKNREESNTIQPDDLIRYTLLNTQKGLRADNIIKL